MTTGKLNYTRGGQTNLKKIVNETTPAFRSYSLAGNELITEDIGSLGGTQLTIFGNGYEVNGNSKAGISISGQTLYIKKGSGENFVWKNFNNNESGGAIWNTGYLYIDSNAKFESNSVNATEEEVLSGGAISNCNILNVGANSIFKLNTALVNGIGGAVYNDWETNIGSNAMFISNKAVAGGAIFNTQYGIMIVEDNTTSSLHKRFFQNIHTGCWDSAKPVRAHIQQIVNAQVLQMFTDALQLFRRLPVLIIR